MAELTIAPSMLVAPVSPTGHVPDDPAKVHDAAQQFEALLLGQIMRSERESGNGWLGSGGDSASSCATDYAEQQFATLLARQGGLGLASLISAGLRSEQEAATGSSLLPHSSLPAPAAKTETRR